MTLALLAGCASGPGAMRHDPLEPFNRGVFRFNEAVDEAVLKPVATTYRDVVPSLAREGVRNFFSNLGEVWSFTNNVLQFKVQAAGETAIRFGVNTLMGLGGLLDIASEMGIERHPEDFGQTLGFYGVPSGPFIELPLLGPSTLRDALALGADNRGNVISSVHDIPSRNSLYLLKAVQTRTDLLRVGAVLDEAALDKYSFTRDAYLQRRRSLIFEDNTAAGASKAQAVGGETAAPEPQTGTDSPASPATVK
jgi:phospholipid-binding lipoprotein MlaA